ncbi:MAG: foldase protein PrsA [Acidobacteriota bacterium]
MRPVSSVLMLVLVACGVDNFQQTSSPEPDHVIARIEGQPITQTDFDQFISVSSSPAGDEDIPRFRTELFREFVSQQILLKEAEAAGIAVSDAEVKQELQDWLSPEPVEVPPELELRTRRFLKVQKFLQEKIGSRIQVSLQEMQVYYEEHEEEFIAADRAHVLEILVLDRVQAERLKKQLSPGDVDAFKELARSHSQGQTALQGGDLGSFERGDLPEEFENFIFSLNPGEISRVFRSSHGFHIFMLEEFNRRHAQKFYEVREDIFRTLFAEKERRELDKLLNHLLETASIDIYDEGLESAWRQKNASIAQ